MMKSYQIIVTSLFVCQLLCKSLMATFSSYPFSTFSCFKQKGISEIVLPFDENGGDQLIHNILNAKNAGLNVQLGFAPCRSITPEYLAEQFKKNQITKLSDRIWIMPLDTGDSHCDWSPYSSIQNCQFLKEVIDILQKNFGFRLNIISNYIFWQRIFGSRLACPQVSDSLLWWTQTEEELDFEPNFKNYKQFGGWKVPYLKLLNQFDICGVSLDSNYYE